jgi:hypothetical protein
MSFIKLLHKGVLVGALNKNNIRFIGKQNDKIMCITEKTKLFHNWHNIVVSSTIENDNHIKKIIEKMDKDNELDCEEVGEIIKLNEDNDLKISIFIALTMFGLVLTM